MVGVDEPDRLELAGEAEAAAILPTVPEEDHARARNPFRALKNRNFAIAWTGIALSNIGSWVQNAVVPFIVYQLTKNPAIVGLVTFLAFAPAVLLGPLAGILAERFDRRRVVLVGAVVSTGATLALFGAWVSGHRSVLAIVVCVMVSGGAAWLTMPAWTALVYDLSAPADVQNAITLNSGQFNLARAVGPALAGVIFVNFGASAAFLVNALSFGFAIGAMLLVRADNRKVAPNPDATIRDGFRYLRSQPALVLPTVLIALAIMCSLPLLQLVPVLAANVLHVGAQQYGYLTAMFGIGGVLGAVIVSAVMHRLHRSQQIVLALLALSVTTAILGLVSSYPLALIAMFGVGLSYLTMASGTNTALQSNVLDAYRGRVLAFYFMVVTLTAPVFSLVYGWLAKVTNVTVVLVFIAACMAASAGVLILRPRLRRLLDGSLAQSAG